MTAFQGKHINIYNAKDVCAQYYVYTFVTLKKKWSAYLFTCLQHQNAAYKT